MKTYGKYVKPYLYAFILGPILMIVEVIGEVVMPKLLQLIIDNGVNAGVELVILLRLVCSWYLRQF